LNRRFDIGPVLVALGALVLLVGLFLRWYGDLNAWDAFELTDVLLAALAVAALVAALGLLAPEAELLDRRVLPWLAGAAFVVTAAELINPPPGAAGQHLGLGAWLSFAAAVAMLVGSGLTFGRVSLAVAVEGRDRRRRVAAVDHRPPPTETGAPVARSSEPLLRSQPEEGEAPESS
jgi:hypothetical protein